MKYAELKDKSVTELNEKLDELSKEHLQLRMQKANGNLAQNHLIGETKKQIARVMTAINAAK